MLLLQRISISLALLVIIFTIFEIFLPIWRFLSRKTDAIMLYRVLKTNILEKKYRFQTDIQLKYQLVVAIILWLFIMKMKP